MQVQNDMVTLTTTANSPTATFVTLTNLKETLLLAEKLQIPSEKLQDLYNSVETMATKVDAVSTQNNSKLSC